MCVYTPKRKKKARKTGRKEEEKTVSDGIDVHVYIHAFRLIARARARVFLVRDVYDTIRTTTAITPEEEGRRGLKTLPDKDVGGLQ